MIHIEVEQGSQEWHDVRRGIPTASEFGRILPPKTLKAGAGAESYLDELIGEKYSAMYPERAESYTSRAMDWGKQTEEEARRYLAMTLDADVRKCGFCMTDDRRFGCSPDALIYEDGVLVAGAEIKCPEPKTHVRYLRENCLPDEHRPQVYGGMFVCGLPKWIFLSYAPGFKPLLVTVKPGIYSTALAEALDSFHLKLVTETAKVRG